VPRALARARAQRDDRVRVEVRATTVAAPVVVGRRSRPEEDEAAARVEREAAQAFAPPAVFQASGGQVS
jgi:hypothetical protein